MTCWARRGKGFMAGIAFDLQPADGQFVLRLVRRVHGLLPDRRADQQERGEDRAAAASRWKWKSCKQLPYFQKVSGTFLELNKNAVVRRHFKKGEIVCREGEYGSTAFYIFEGKAQVYLSTPMAHVKTARRRDRIFQQADQPPGGPPAGPARRRRRRGVSIPIDAPVDLALRQSGGRAWPRRSVRRNDLHEPVPAVGDGARRPPTA